MSQYIMSNSIRITNRITKFESKLKHLILAPFLIFITPLIVYSQSYELFVSSRNTASVKYYDGTTGAYKGDFVPPNSGGLSSTQEVTFGLDGHLYVSGRGNTAIKKYDGVTGKFIGDFTSGYDLDNPTKMTFGPDSMLYISQWGAKTKVARFNSVTGHFIDEFTEIGLNNGCGHAWDANGNLYVASFGSKDVRKFDINGKFLGVFTEVGHLQGAVNLWFDDDGDLLVVDWNLGSVLRFDGATGAYKSVFISGMTNTEGVTIGPDGLLYFCDWTRNEIVRYDASGAKVGVFTTEGGMLQPNSLVFALTSRTTVSVEETHGNLPVNYKLQQNFPNPFNPATIIKYSLSKSDEVSLIVYNLGGQEVARLVNGEQNAGSHKVAWDASRMASGVYLYRLRAGDFVQTRKMLLLK